MSADAASHHSPGQMCPRCNAPTFRVSRRFIDLLISVVVPLRRYRCRSMKCGWEGNFRNKQLVGLDYGNDRKYEDCNYHLMESSRMRNGIKPSK